MVRKPNISLSMRMKMAHIEAKAAAKYASLWSKKALIAICFFTLTVNGDLVPAAQHITNLSHAIIHLTSIAGNYIPWHI